MTAAICRLRKHADYQRVYKASRKQFTKQMSYFFLLRGPANPVRSDITPSWDLRAACRAYRPQSHRQRRGSTVIASSAACGRQYAGSLPCLLQAPVDVVLHPRRSVIDLDFAALEREVAAVFRAIQKATGATGGIFCRLPRWIERRIWHQRITRCITGSLHRAIARRERRRARG